MTNRSIYEIEVALAKHFDCVRNIIAFNVYGEGAKLFIGHECDMLVLTKSGYLTEIEIKRSFEDFLNEFNKKHRHESELVKRFYYAVPASIEDKVVERLEELNNTAHLLTYDEDLNIRKIKLPYVPEWRRHRRLFLEEQLEVARFGAMRSVMLKEKLIEDKTDEL